YPWLTADLAPINRPIEFDQLERLLSETGGDRAVLVQLAETDEDTDYLHEIAAAHPEIAGVVGWLAVAAPAAAAERRAGRRRRSTSAVARRRGSPGPAGRSRPRATRPPTASSRSPPRAPRSPGSSAGWRSPFRRRRRSGLPSWAGVRASAGCAAGSSWRPT